MAPKKDAGAKGKAKAKNSATKGKAKAAAGAAGHAPAEDVATATVRETNKNHLQRLEDALNRIMAHPVFADIATAEPAEINSAAGHLSGDQVRVAKAFAVYDRCSTAVIGKCGA